MVRIDILRMRTGWPHYRPDHVSINVEELKSKIGRCRSRINTAIGTTTPSGSNMDRMPPQGQELRGRADAEYKIDDTCPSMMHMRSYNIPELPSWALSIMYGSCWRN
eukprot:2906562-Amphidinium_carterae.1